VKKNMQNNSKGYLELKRKVLDKNYCVKCGACAIVCPVNKILFLDYSIMFNKDVNCINCKLCTNVCPKIDNNFVNFSNKEKYYSAKSTRIVGQDGGLATEFLIAAIELNIVDAIIAVNKDRFWRPIPVVVNSIEDIEKCKFTKFGEVCIFCSLPKVRDKKVCIIGPPCIVNAARKLQKLKYNNIKLIVGLFCSENFEYNGLINFLRNENVAIDEIVKFKVKKGFFEVITKSGTFKFKLERLKSLVMDGCKICQDFCALNADVSIGSAGSEDGYSTVIIRSKIGKKIFEFLIKKNRIVLNNNLDTSLIRKMIRKKSKK